MRPSELGHFCGNEFCVERPFPVKELVVDFNCDTNWAKHFVCFFLFRISVVFRLTLISSFFLVCQLVFPFH